MAPEASTETTSSLMESASSAREEQEMSCGERELVMMIYDDLFRTKRYSTHRET